MLVFDFLFYSIHNCLIRCGPKYKPYTKIAIAHTSVTAITILLWFNIWSLSSIFEIVVLNWPLGFLIYSILTFYYFHKKRYLMIQEKFGKNNEYSHNLTGHILVTVYILFSIFGIIIRA